MPNKNPIAILVLKLDNFALHVGMKNKLVIAVFRSEAIDQYYRRNKLYWNTRPVYNIEPTEEILEIMAFLRI